MCYFNRVNKTYKEGFFCRNSQAITTNIKIKPTLIYYYNKFIYTKYV